MKLLSTYSLGLSLGVLGALISRSEGAEVLVPAGSTWKYLHDGSDQGTLWIGHFFDDSTWASGPAQLGYGDGDEATLISTNRFITTYFRHDFSVPDASSITNLLVRLLRDDGAVVYLNGVEVFRSNMPTGEVTFTTLALTAVGGADENTFFPSSVPPGLLISGVNTNTLSVEVHQNSVSSSDLSFDLELAANTTIPEAPTIVTQPQDQTVFAGADVTFFVEATGTEPLSYVWRRNNVPVPSGTNSLLTLFNVQPTNAGNYSVIVSNLAGASVSSNAVLQVLLTSNLPPVVTLTSPVDGATFVAPANILLSATATDFGGTVTQVEFFAGSNKIAQDLIAPYNVVWTNVQPGSYQLTAVATDNSNAVTVSTPVNITVTTGAGGTLTLVSTGAVWRYLDNGSDQGTAWAAPGFDDSTWAFGPAQLGYGDGDEATVVAFGPDPANKFITTYFRRTFSVTNTASITGLTVRLLRDDGGVVYLNGLEVFRSNMPTGPIAFNTLAFETVDETSFFPAQLPPNLLVSGANLLAVEIHQASVSSSDISFDLDLVAQVSSATNRVPPTIVTQPQSQTVFAGGNVTFSVVATGTPPLIYRWRHDGTTVAVTTNGFLALFNVQTNQAGFYSVVVTNVAGIAISSNALLQVLQIPFTNQPPSFTKGPDITVSEADVPAAYRFDRWASNIQSGPPGEPAQGLTFIVTTDNPGLFATLPAVEAVGGALTFATAAQVTGLAIVTVVLMDDGGTADGGVDTSAPQTFVIQVVPANSPPVARALVSPLSILFPDQTNLVVVSPNNSNAPVVLDASLSSDADNDPLQFAWMEEAVTIAAGARATNELEVGTHSITLVADDGKASSTDTATFEVITAGDAVDSISTRLDNSALPSSVRRPLIETLRGAEAAFDAGNFELGTKRLQVFQDKVQSRVTPADPDLGTLLINAAQAIIDAVNSP